MHTFLKKGKTADQRTRRHKRIHKKDLPPLTRKQAQEYKQRMKSCLIRRPFDRDRPQVLLEYQ